jgi:putative alpha-1,2-mannosidase
MEITFEMTATDNEYDNYFIQNASLNGQPLDRPFITHDEIMNGARLSFKMGESPNKSWASDLNNAPYSMSKE